ncbi:hypothetical protein H7K45_27605 [Mycobacterium yunnanensis]|uniref:Uncharacterized protein n=1 Tax=Mycobacterium yunnanensis TaxID=368477 RepID=A0A9X2Z9W7_9MYCO|nr:hypothetical protein [Mycobacterium yunnanensis]MCV7424320.1 hypothetical protein [Mycobacterium yunnanensis]
MAVGDLIPWRGRWITEPPTHCGNGHRFGSQRVLVGHVACMGHGGGGHTTWHCRECDHTTYGPALAKHCTVLAGPAAVRISGDLPELRPSPIPPTPW